MASGALTTFDLGSALQRAHPGQYDDLSPEAIGRGLKAKYPGQYDDFMDLPGIQRPAAPTELQGAPQPGFVQSAKAQLPKIPTSKAAAVDTLAGMGMPGQREAYQFGQNPTPENAIALGKSLIPFYGPVSTTAQQVGQGNFTGAAGTLTTGVALPAALMAVPGVAKAALESPVGAGVKAVAGDFPVLKSFGKFKGAYQDAQAAKAAADQAAQSEAMAAANRANPKTPGWQAAGTTNTPDPGLGPIEPIPPTVTRRTPPTPQLPAPPRNPPVWQTAGTTTSSPTIPGPIEPMPPTSLRRTPPTETSTRTPLWQKNGLAAPPAPDLPRPPAPVPPPAPTTSTINPTAKVTIPATVAPAAAPVESEAVAREPFAPISKTADVPKRYYEPVEHNNPKAAYNADIRFSKYLDDQGYTPEKIHSTKLSDLSAMRKANGQKAYDTDRVDTPKRVQDLIETLREEQAKASQE